MLCRSGSFPAEHDISCRVGARPARELVFFSAFGYEANAVLNGRPYQDDTSPGLPTQHVGSFTASSVDGLLRPRIFWPLPHVKVAHVLDCGVQVCPARRTLLASSEAPARTCQVIEVLSTWIRLITAA